MSGLDYIKTDELLVQAAYRGEYERVKEMLDHGAVASARNHYLLTALHWAVTMGHVRIVQLLIERGADPNARAADGNTPLHMSAREGDLETLEYLLSAGADPELCNDQSRTALDLARDFAEDEPQVAHALRSAAIARQGTARLRGPSRAAALAAPLLQATSSAAAAGADMAKGGMHEMACGSDEPLDLGRGDEVVALCGVGQGAEIRSAQSKAGAETEPLAAKGLERVPKMVASCSGGASAVVESSAVETLSAELGSTRLSAREMLIREFLAAQDKQAQAHEDGQVGTISG